MGRGLSAAAQAKELGLVDETGRDEGPAPRRLLARLTGWTKTRFRPPPYWQAAERTAFRFLAATCWASAPGNVSLELACCGQPLWLWRPMSEGQHLRGPARCPTTAEANTVAAISRPRWRSFLDALTKHNSFAGEPRWLVGHLFGDGRDLTACFPAAIFAAPHRLGTGALLDCQQMAVRWRPPRCIRAAWAHAWMEPGPSPVHPYLRSSLSSVPGTESGHNLTAGRLPPATPLLRSGQRMGLLLPAPPRLRFHALPQPLRQLRRDASAAPARFGQPPRRLLRPPGLGGRSAWWPLWGGAVAPQPSFSPRGTPGPGGVPLGGTIADYNGSYYFMTDTDAKRSELLLMLRAKDRKHGHSQASVTLPDNSRAKIEANDIQLCYMQEAA